MAPVQPEPQRMEVEFGLFKGDTLVKRGRFVATARRALETFEHNEDPQSPGVLTIEHKFDLPAATVSLTYWTGATEPRLRLFRASLAMGVHRSKDWEKVALMPPYEFAFRGKPLP